ncbi:hypothetical protein [Sphingomonas sp. KC8]|uniref:hypothetical protein n=1 Tax=Sphingomonas sp. KC8 TaxID=1030157 RepID=UPI0011104F95|nr:hypothetical protein [Sphingomonas sp. KC8]
MDYNYLYHRHQISLIRAGAAKSVEARFVHEQLAGLYARAVELIQSERPPESPRPAKLITRVSNPTLFLRP